MHLIHGGDIYGYAERHGGALPLDLSANINPFGIPQAVRQAMHDALDHCDRYPDPLCRALSQAVGEVEQVPPSWLFFGNGAADVLFRLSAVIKPRKALLTAPTFAEYEQSLPDCKIYYHYLTEAEGFAVTPRILQDIKHGINAVYLCNPNNPTGLTLSPTLLREIYAACVSIGAYLVVDECFNDFLTDAAAHTVKHLLPRYPKLIILHAFTKMYAIPGVRLGYCMCADPACIEALRQAGQPWNVSVIAQACGVAAVGLRGFAQQTAQRVAEERGFLAQALRRRGITVFDGQANFLLWKAQDTALHQKLEGKGVLIRDCSNYRGLAPGFYRTAVKQREDSLRFLRALDDIL